MYDLSKQYTTNQPTNNPYALKLRKNKFNFIKLYNYEWLTQNNYGTNNKAATEITIAKPINKP